MRRDRPLVVLTACQLLVTGATFAFHLTVRPHLLETYAEAGVALSAPAALALSPAALPLAAVAGTLAAAAALLYRGQRLRRLQLLSAGLVLSGFAFVGGVLASIAPLFGS